jgi:MtrB/PioB family decaheme-associated outer membrane protein
MNAYLEHTAVSPRRRALYTAVLSALLLAWTLPAIGQDDFTLDDPVAPPPDPEKVAELTERFNTVEVGLGWVSGDSFRFGRYNGMESEGLFAVLNVDYLRCGPYDGDSAEYLAFTASDLGLSSREAAFEYGRQGNFAVRVEYDQIPAFRSDTASTIFQGSGGTSLTLPPDWVAGANTAGMPLLRDSLHPVDLETERRRTSIGLRKLFGPSWTFAARFGNEDKDGLKSIGGVFGNTGGNPRAALLAEPVDYQTRDFEASASYSNPRTQVLLRYHLSLFENDNAALQWQNPYSAIGGWDASVGYPTGFGQIALPPDNRFHQVSAAAGYDLSGRTRVSGDVAFGRMTQDEAFLPYTVNPVLAASITQPLPRNSLDGRIDTTVVNLRLTSRPGDRFHWGGSFRYDDRDNQTPRSEYVYIGGDSQLQDTGETSSRRRFNEPYSYQEMKLRLDGAWRLGRSGRLSGSAERREIERTYSEREEATEDTFVLGFNQDFSDMFGASLRLRHADRSGSTYHGDEPFLSGYSPGYTSTVGGGWENPPGLRKFHLADRDRDQIALMATLSPSQHWSFGFEADRAVDDYSRSELGLTESRIAAYSFDATFTPSVDWTAYAFYTWESLRMQQNGHSIQGGANHEASLADPGRAWAARHRDRVDTFGGGLNWRVTEDRFDLGFDVIDARSDSEIDVTAGSALTVAPLPDLGTRMQSVGLNGRFRIRSNLAFNVRWWYEKYRSEDWALDIPADQLANVILLGEESADYDIHVLLLSLSYRY